MLKTKIIIFALLLILISGGIAFASGYEKEVKGISRSFNSKENRIRAYANNLNSYEDEIYAACFHNLTFFGKEAVQAVLDELEKGQYVRRARERALEFLAKTNDRRALPALRKYFAEDPCRWVKLQAAYGLANIENNSNAMKYLHDSLQDQHDGVRRVTAYLISKLGKPSSLETLLKKVDDPDPDVRLYIYKTLGKIGGEKAIKALKKAFKEENEDAPKIYAGGAVIRNEKNEEISKYLLGMVDPDVPMNYAGYAGSMLAQAGDKRAVEPILGLLGKLCMGSWRDLIPALGKLPDPRGAARLIEIYTDKNVMYMHESIAPLVPEALLAMGPIGAKALAEGIPQVEEIKIHSCGLLLGEFGEEAVEPAKSLLTNDNIKVRRSGITALKRCGSPEVYEMLVERYRNDKDSLNRKVALEALGNFNNDNAIELIEPHLLAADDYFYNAIRALSELGTPAAVERLVNAASYFAYEKADPNNCREIVNRIAYDRFENAADLYVKLLDHEKLDLAAAGAFALGKLENKKYIDLLVLKFESARPKVKEKIAEAMSHMPDPRAITLLVETVEEAASTDRHIAIETLIEIGSPSVEPLLAAFDNASITVKSEILQAFGRIGDKKATKKIIPLLESEAPQLKQPALIALGLLRDSSAAGPIVEFCKTAPFQLKGAGLIVLGNVSDASIADDIIEIYKGEENELIKSVAVYALARSGSQKACPFLLECLDSKIKEVRGIALEGLTHCGNASITSAVAKLLSDEDKQIRAQAALTINKIGDASALEGLIELLKDSFSGAQIEAEEALTKFTGVSFGNDYELWKKWYKKNRDRFEKKETPPPPDKKPEKKEPVPGEEEEEKEKKEKQD